MSILSKLQNPNDIKNISKQDFKPLADELRGLIIKVVSENGGHLAGSLGVVELTIALHYVFDLPDDKIIWDVGHQSYAHKILSGRKDKFKSLRQWEGISGFPKISESEYDAFGAGHSSTAVSAALGIACARDILGRDQRIVAVVGDGGMTGGLAFEGLNNAGHLNKDMLVILNDNEMFISERVGALGKYLTKILSGGFFMEMEELLEKIAKRVSSHSQGLMKVAKRMKTLLTPGMFFEEMGFCYLGPMDGHDTEGLIEALKNIKRLKGPVLLHIITKKGKGYKPAEDDPGRFHGIGSFDSATGVSRKTEGEAQSYTKVFGDTLVNLAEKDPRIVAITAAMPEGTGLTRFAKKFPDRFFDVGIAEEHALTFAAGLASGGIKPVCAIYSTFMQRAFDQIIHDICLQKLPVVLALDRAGIVGEDGATHNGVFDLSYLRMIPNIIVMAPADEKELQAMLKTAFHSNRPCAIRYPRGSGLGLNLYSDIPLLDIGRPDVRITKGEALVIAIGGVVRNSLSAVQKLENEGCFIKFINARFAKPIERDKIIEMSSDVKCVITVEENALMGGFGSAVKETLEGIDVPVYSIGIPDDFVKHGAVNTVRDAYGLSADKLYERFKRIITERTLAKEKA
ncbi:MAG: 1-deoxy-D-xylulose-5-phosphate synthase [Elusimicrobiota bacterium]